MRTSLLLAFLGRTTSLRGELLILADFETGALSQLGIQAAARDAVAVVATPVRAGRYAAKTLLRTTDPKVNKGQRAEFSDRHTQILMDQHYWNGLNVFVPGGVVSPPRTRLHAQHRSLHD